MFAFYFFSPETIYLLTSSRYISSSETKQNVENKELCSLWHQGSHRFPLFASEEEEDTLTKKNRRKSFLVSG